MVISIRPVKRNGRGVIRRRLAAFCWVELIVCLQIHLATFWGFSPSLHSLATLALQAGALCAIALVALDGRRPWKPSPRNVRILVGFSLYVAWTLLYGLWRLPVPPAGLTAHAGNPMAITMEMLNRSDSLIRQGLIVRIMTGIWMFFYLLAGLKLSGQRALKAEKALPSPP